jgi:hypothetical protein
MNCGARRAAVALDDSARRHSLLRHCARHDYSFCRPHPARRLRCGIHLTQLAGRSAAARRRRPARADLAGNCDRCGDRNRPRHSHHTILFFALKHLAREIAGLTVAFTPLHQSPAPSISRVEGAASRIIHSRIECYFFTTWPRPSRISLPLNFGITSTRLAGSALSPACGTGPL